MSGSASFISGERASDAMFGVGADSSELVGEETEVLGEGKKTEAP